MASLGLLLDRICAGLGTLARLTLNAGEQNFFEKRCLEARVAALDFDADAK
jgi:hypothetical protein